MLFKSIVTIFLSISLLFFPSIIYASKDTLITKQELIQSGFTKYEQINPNLLIYPIKQVIEKMKLSSIKNEKDKTAFQYTLLDKRYRELVFIINTKKTGFLEETVQRYNSQAGILLINKETAIKHESQLSRYITVLKTMQDRYDSLSSYRLLIQQAIDTTKRLI